MTLRIAKTRPVLALLVITALSSESRRRIVKELLQARNGLSASQISKRLGLSIPTILSHLDKLLAAGIVRAVPVRERGRIQKLYRVIDKELQLVVDLNLLSKVPPEDVLKEQLERYIKESRKTMPLSERFDPDRIMEVLGVDFETAIMLADYFNMCKEDIVSILVEELREKLSGREEVSLAEIENYLRVTTFWAIKVAGRMEELGLVRVKY